MERSEGDFWGREKTSIKKKSKQEFAKQEREREEKSLIQTVARLGYVSGATYKELPYFTYHFYCELYYWKWANN